ncbi:MAG TPA: dihydroorotase [Bacteroidota bacterium]|nr:dihydroorotase [Bacteroidota bacterium]
MTSYLFKNGRIVDPVSGRDAAEDILITDGIIEAIGPVPEKKSHRIIDLAGAIVAPGLCDMHVHLREPGFEHKETIDTGTLAAAAGGFTAVCCMPNTNPAIDDASVVRSIVAKSRSLREGVVDLHPIAAVTKGREGKDLAPILELAEAGAVGFSDDGAPVGDALVMRRALEYAALTGRPLIQHAEDPSLAKGGVMNEGFVSTRLGLPGIPSLAEEIMVDRDIRLLRYTGGKYHVAHVSTAGTVELIRAAKKEGLAVTCEVTPHHWTLTDDAVAGYDTNTKMNPPLRSAADVDAMKAGLRDGTIDVIATDHAPHSFDEKEVEFQYAPFGIVGLETALGLVFSGLVDTGILTISQVIEKLSVNPRKILSLPTLEIAPGKEANLSFIDAKREWTVDVSAFRSKSRNTPFHGRRLRGRAIGIFNHGRLFLADGGMS